jgi:hypothetical protein
MPEGALQTPPLLLSSPRKAATLRRAERLRAAQQQQQQQHPQPDGSANGWNVDGVRTADTMQRISLPPERTSTTRAAAAAREGGATAQAAPAPVAAPAREQIMGCGGADGVKGSAEEEGQIKVPQQPQPQPRPHLSHPEAASHTLRRAERLRRAQQQQQRQRQEKVTAAAAAGDRPSHSSSDNIGGGGDDGGGGGDGDGDGDGGGGGAERERGAPPDFSLRSAQGRVVSFEGTGLPRRSVMDEARRNDLRQRIERTMTQQDQDSAGIGDYHENGCLAGFWAMARLVHESASKDEQPGATIIKQLMASERYLLQSISTSWTIVDRLVIPCVFGECSVAVIPCAAPLPQVLPPEALQRARTPGRLQLLRSTAHTHCPRPALSTAQHVRRGRWYA